MSVRSMKYEIDTQIRITRCSTIEPCIEVADAQRCDGNETLVRLAESVEIELIKNR